MYSTYLCFIGVLHTCQINNQFKLLILLSHIFKKKIQRFFWSCITSKVLSGSEERTSPVLGCRDGSEVKSICCSYKGWTPSTHGAL